MLWYSAPKFACAYSLFSILLRLSLSLLGLVAQSDNLDDLFLVEIFEASGGDYILIVFLCEE